MAGKCYRRPIVSGRTVKCKKTGRNPRHTKEVMRSRRKNSPNFRAKWS